MEKHELINTEKELVALLYSKCLSYHRVLEIYREACLEYEKRLFNSFELLESQEVEFCLWKLHYKLIHEFRKRSRQIPDVKHEGEDKAMKNFKSFLSEATKFYRHLVYKLRETCGFPNETFLNGTTHHSLGLVEPAKMQTCQWTCHRLLVCLGDIARYIEVARKPSEGCDWSAAANYYVEAARTWPCSGNPHNQLGLLATYFGDAFLALYHFVRSSNAKEPFPDSQRNIDLLLERDAAVKVPEEYKQNVLDFSNLSKKGYLRKVNKNVDEQSDMWMTVVSMTSILLRESSSDELRCTFLFALHLLEAFLSEDDVKLDSSLECHQQLDSSNCGPHRVLQLVSIFIFTANHLNEGKPLALAAIFIFMGRITERCLNENGNNCCSLLPGILVFLEWLVEAFDAVEASNSDERVMTSLSYFSETLIDLIHQMELLVKDEQNSLGPALWEDHELRGFHPLAGVHEMLDFSCGEEYRNDYMSGTEWRAKRILRGATSLMKFISNEKLGSTSHFSLKEIRKGANADKKESLYEETSGSSSEDEEVIVFKPVTRHSCPPLYTSKPAHLPHGMNEETMRRITFSPSLTTEETSGLSFCSCGRNVKLSIHETPNDPMFSPYLPPPSLSSWNMGAELNLNAEREHRRNDLCSRIPPSPIDEMSSTYTSDDSGTYESKMCLNPLPHPAPIPSAPLLPEEAIWEGGHALFPHEYGRDNSFFATTPVFDYHPVAGSGFGQLDSSSARGMSSSEWLHHYRNNQNPPLMNPLPCYGDFTMNKLSRLQLFDHRSDHGLDSKPVLRWGTPQLDPSFHFAHGAKE